MGRFRHHGRLAMAEPADTLPPEEPTAEPPPIRTGEASGMLDWLITVARYRDLRRRFFDPGFASDPAWDLLMALAIARLEGRSLDTAELQDGIAATSARSIRLLVEQGFCELDDNPATAHLRFTARGWDEMRRYVQAALAGR